MCGCPGLSTPVCTIWSNVKPLLVFLSLSLMYMSWVNLSAIQFLCLDKSGNPGILLSLKRQDKSNGQWTSIITAVMDVLKRHSWTERGKMKTERNKRGNNEWSEYKLYSYHRDKPIFRSDEPQRYEQKNNCLQNTTLKVVCLNGLLRRMYRNVWNGFMETSGLFTAK